MHPWPNYSTAEGLSAICLSFGRRQVLTQVGGKNAEELRDWKIE